MRLSSLPHGVVGKKGEKPLDLADWFETASQWGLDGVELMDRWVMDGLMGSTDRDLMSRIEDELDERGLQVSAVINHGPYVWPDRKRCSLEMKKARFFLEWADSLGTDILRVTTGAMVPGVSDDEGRRIFVDYIGELLPDARRRGISIALEEHPGFAATVEKVERILEAIPDPGFGFAFDMKNTMREGENPLVILDRKHVLDRVIYTHVDNYRQTESGWNRSVTLAEGEIDIRSLVLGLRSNGYDGWLSVEYGGENLDQLLSSIEWLRSIWR